MLKLQPITLNNITNLKFKISIGLLIAFYSFGIAGILTNNQTIDFLSLTPLNLIVNLFLLLINHQNGTKIQWVIFASIAIFGFLIEVIGVNTGYIFGDYVYESTLGWKLFNTPFVIGINWLILTYGVVYTFSGSVNRKITTAFIGACVLLLLDILIEPVAMNYDFWTWKNNVVPLKNYVAWFSISFFLCYIISFFKGESKNKLAIYLLIFQFVFFGIFNLVIWK